MSLLGAWDADRDQRAAINERIRNHLRGLTENQVPPLRGP